MCIAAKEQRHLNSVSLRKEQDNSYAIQHSNSLAAASHVGCRMPPPARLLLRGDSPSTGEVLRSLPEVRPSSLLISVGFLTDLLPSPAVGWFEYGQTRSNNMPSSDTRDCWHCAQL
jgi:hypothetical protein